MSTIFACFDPDAPVANATIEAMLAASDYWEPDATSHASNRGGHCRLARASLFNTATSRLDSAIADGQGNLITANARLDNRKQLAAELGIPAKALANTSDSRLILSAYLKWGEGCPKHLLGDFAFVIWDEARRQLFCARDHFGVKALFYARRGHSIMASNEHNAFFTSAWLQKIISEQWLVSELWVIGNKTVSPYQDIAMLPPAHSLRFDAAGKLSLTRYWQLEDKDDWQGMEDESLIRELATRFRQAVRVRLESAYPLAAELSEGVDSNGVVGYAAGLLGDDPLLTLSYNCRRLVDDNRRVWEKTYQDIFAMLAMHPNLEPVWQDGEDNTQQDLQTFFRHAGGGDEYPWRPFSPFTSGPRSRRACPAFRLGRRSLCFHLR